MNYTPKDSLKQSEHQNTSPINFKNNILMTDRFNIDNLNIGIIKSEDHSNIPSEYHSIREYIPTAKVYSNFIDYNSSGKINNDLINLEINPIIDQLFENTIDENFLYQTLLPIFPISQFHTFYFFQLFFQKKFQVSKPNIDNILDELKKNYIYLKNALFNIDNNNRAFFTNFNKNFSFVEKFKKNPIDTNIYNTINTSFLPNYLSFSKNRAMSYETFNYFNSDYSNISMIDKSNDNRSDLFPYEYTDNLSNIYVQPAYEFDKKSSIRNLIEICMLKYQNNPPSFEEILSLMAPKKFFNTFIDENKNNDRLLIKNYIKNENDRLEKENEIQDFYTNINKFINDELQKFAKYMKNKEKFKTTFIVGRHQSGKTTFIKNIINNIYENKKSTQNPIMVSQMNNENKKFFNCIYNSYNKNFVPKIVEDLFAKKSKNNPMSYFYNKSENFDFDTKIKNIIMRIPFLHNNKRVHQDICTNSIYHAENFCPVICDFDFSTNESEILKYYKYYKLFDAEKGQLNMNVYSFKTSHPLQNNADESNENQLFLQNNNQQQKLNHLINLIKCKFDANKCIKQEHPVILLGNTGCGKSLLCSFLKDKLSVKLHENFPSIQIETEISQITNEHKIFQDLSSYNQFFLSNCFYNEKPVLIKSYNKLDYEIANLNNILAKIKKCKAEIQRCIDKIYKKTNKKICENYQKTNEKFYKRNNKKFCKRKKSSFLTLEKIIQQLEVGIENNDEKSVLTFLSIIYKKRKVSKRTKRELAKFIKNLALTNNPTAMLIYAIFLEDGFGVRHSERKAIHFFKKAAKRGNVSAMFHYALILYKRKGIKANDEEAALYFWLAAEKGNVDSMYFYAVMLENGRGVQKNEIEALKYYKMAAENGSSQGKEKYNNLKEKLEESTINYRNLYRRANQNHVSISAELFKNRKNSKLNEKFKNFVFTDVNRTLDVLKAGIEIENSDEKYNKKNIHDSDEKINGKSANDYDEKVNGKNSHDSDEKDNGKSANDSDEKDEESIAKFLNSDFGSSEESKSDYEYEEEEEAEENENDVLKSISNNLKELQAARSLLSAESPNNVIEIKGFDVFGFQKGSFRIFHRNVSLSRQQIIEMINSLTVLYEGNNMTFDRSELIRFINEMLNNDKDIEEIRKSAQQGDDRSMLQYGFLLFTGQRIKQDQQEGARYIKMAAKKRNVIAMYIYAYLSYLGIGVEKNIEEAKRFMKEASEERKKRKSEKTDNNNIENYKNYLDENVTSTIEAVNKLLRQKQQLQQTIENITTTIKNDSNSSTKASNDQIETDAEFQKMQSDLYERIKHSERKEEEARKKYLMELRRSKQTNDHSNEEELQKKKNDLFEPNKYSEEMSRSKRIFDKQSELSVLNSIHALKNRSGISVNTRESSRYFKFSPEKGNSEPMFSYSIILDPGEGISTSKKEAEQYFKMSTDRGVEYGMLNPTMSMKKGDGNSGNKNEIEPCLKMAEDNERGNEIERFANWMNRDNTTEDPNNEDIQNILNMANEGGTFNSIMILALMVYQGICPRLNRDSNNDADDEQSQNNESNDKADKKDNNDDDRN